MAFNIILFFFILKRFLRNVTPFLINKICFVSHYSWLKDNLNLLNHAKECEAEALSVKDNGDVYFVPAFSGLYSPWWRGDARG